MSDIGWIIVITAVAGVGGTGLGGAVGALLKRDSSRIVSLLLAFAGGIMTGVVCFDMISGALEPDGATEPVSVFFVVAGVLFGYVVIWLLNLWIDKKTNHEIAHIDADHPKTADDLDELIHSDHYVRHETCSEDGGPASKYQLFIAGVVMACAPSRCTTCPRAWSSARPTRATWKPASSAAPASSWPS